MIIEQCSFDDFEKVDIRVGRIVEVDDFPEARLPAYRLTIDFGPEIGLRQSSSRITEHYSKGDLQNRLVMAVVNFPPKQIGPFLSECLTLGFYDAAGKVILCAPDREVPLGARLG
jgi:tRNA-binding protein